MKRSVDLAECLGYACCMRESPNLFDIRDDSGLATLLVEGPSDDQRDEAERAVRVCPAGVNAVEGLRTADYQEKIVRISGE
ncbi:ferredoxin [Streptomyces antnestii]|uniref:Ferredoxin n=2 Tax=Streptomyces antnestii TaxID=2494256 RepID=A0A3S2Z5G1_9ACTN|nr:ferredoxin [Streptomyces sp. San01]